jgi:hypothetical protein
VRRFAGFNQYDRAGCGVGHRGGEAAVGELGHRPARGPADRDDARVDVVGVRSEEPTCGGVIADAGEHLAGGGDAVRGQPVKVAQDCGVCLLGVLGVDGQFLDYGGLADVHNLQRAAGVAGDCGGRVDGFGGVFGGADRDDDRSVPRRRCAGEQAREAVADGTVDPALLNRSVRRRWPRFIRRVGAPGPKVDSPTHRRHGDRDVLGEGEGLRVNQQHFHRLLWTLSAGCLP